MKYFNLSSYHNELNLAKLQKQFSNLNQKIQALERIQNHQYKNKKIAAIALLHGSALVYWPNNKEDIFSNEKFEYLGDSFLNFFIASYSMSLLPKLSEGDYSKLRAQIVGESNLASKARKLNLANCLMFGKSYHNSPNALQDGIIADAFEAITAALFLDGGFKKVSAWLSNIFKEDILTFSEHLEDIDVKGAVQNWTQRHKGCVPTYEAIDCTQDIRNPEFEVSLMINNEIIATARAQSKKEAGLKAAQKTLKLIKSGKIQ